MAILQTSDFNTGEYTLPKDSFTVLQSYITKYEQYYLVRLLGADLYDLFVADLTLTTPQIPQSPVYESIFNAFYYDEDGALFVSDGIKEMLKQFIYFHFLRDTAYRKTVNGVVVNATESSEHSGYNGYNLIEAYNSAIDNAYSIQSYIENNSNDYLTYNGITFCFASGI